MFTKFLTAIFGGYLLNKSFQSGYWFLAIVALAIFLWLLDRSNLKQRLVITFLFSGSFFLLHLTWMKVIGTDAWILLSIISFVPWLLISLIKFNRRSYSSLLVISSTLVLVEVIRSHFPWGGFPWGLVAYGQVDGALIQLAKVGGQSLVTFAVAICAGLLLQIVTRFRLSAVLLFVFIAFAVSLINPVTAPEDLRLVAIQGNVPRIGLDLRAQRAAVLNNHLNVTKEFIASNSSSSKPALIIWPESSTDIDPIADRQVAAEIQDVVNQAQSPVLVGATVWGSNPEGPRNSGILWTKSGPTTTYVKNHLVPFGEYIPMREFLSSFIQRIELVPNDFVPGNQLGMFEVNNVVFGDVICFEVAYGDYIRHLVNDGAQFISIQTNNATYGRTEQPEQQFQISRFRAIEHQKSVIVASTSGISGAINQNGEVLAKTQQFVPAIVDVQLPIATSKSFSDRYPRWATITCSIIALIGLASSLKRTKIA